MNRIFATTLTALAVLATAGAAQAAAPKTLHSFCTRTDCSDGKQPWGAPVADADGDYYGTTLGGGASQSEGTVYRMHYDGAKWVYTRVHAFCTRSGCPDGGQLRGGLIADTAGNLYGMANEGGAANWGTIFELSPNGGAWTVKVLHSFCTKTGCPDGARPGFSSLSYQGQAAGALYDGTSPLYGTTLNGGANGSGVVFTLVPGATKWTLKVIHNFCARAACADGGQSYTPVTVDGAGDLFGVTTVGGAYNHGAVFALARAAGGWKETVLHSFCAGGGFCSDGDSAQGALAIDGGGHLIGTTYFGGASGHGAVFRVAPTGEGFTTLHSFCATTGCPDGAHPRGGVIFDSKGHLVGTTYDGGAGNTGTIFKLAGTHLDRFTPLYSFGAASDGQYAVSGLTADPSGALFGTAVLGGANSQGTIFAIAP